MLSSVIKYLHSIGEMSYITFLHTAQDLVQSVKLNQQKKTFISRSRRALAAISIVARYSKEERNQRTTLITHSYKPKAF